ncbi:asparagine synthase C-terminal domain-containing protein [Parabacteroides sp. OttesenSCG-928-K15]|nr:asparagine synthase C-terminal domain-containing protein [Parabacteroides sp. OttesenSCG-928-K15]
MITTKLYRKNWTTHDGVSTIGWAEWQGKNYTGEDFCRMIVRETNKQVAKLFQLIMELNGSFAIVIRHQYYIILFTDHIRSYPLYYIKKEGKTYITDLLPPLFREYGLHPEPDIRNAEIFLTAGLTLEDHTIYKEVYSPQAAEMVEVYEGEYETIKWRYYSYEIDPSETRELCLEEEVGKQNEIFERAFRRTINSAPEVRNWVLPLSGGHDSRMVIHQMHKLGVKNLVCYSYGEPGNKQSRLSEEVARKLGYAWHFVAYTPEKWKNLRESSVFNEYFDFAFNGVSDPHIQDLLAVAELKREGIVQPGDIFVPGHTFDFLAGAYCLEGIEDLRTDKDIYRYLSPYFNQWEYAGRNRTVFKELTAMIKESGLKGAAFTEYFHWQERHAKFIQNSVRVYEYFGFDWRTPLWDVELMKYWQKIPLKYKKQRNFLFLCEKNGLYTEPLASIPFDSETEQATGIKEKLLATLPASWKRKLKYHLRKETPHSDDALYTLYAADHLLFPDGMPYRQLPKALRRYLKPYLGRPLHWFPDNDNNTLYAMRELFPADRANPKK